MTVHLSPSEHHKHVMSQTVPSLRYDGGHRFYADDA